MIRVEFPLTRPARCHPTLDDDFTVMCDVDVSTRKVTICSGTVKRAGTVLDRYSLSRDDLLFDFEVSVIEAIALEEAVNHPSCCEHCGRAETRDALSGVCACCLPEFGELGAGNAREVAKTALEKTLALRGREVSDRDLASIIRAFRSLYDDGSARVLVEAQQASAAE